MTTSQAAKAAAIKSFPAPAQLATITDLKPEQVQKITEAINPLVADAFALYVKTKNFHWHLSGSHFRDYHLMLDEHADSIFASIDPLAERVRRIGGTTIRSISHVNQLQTIQDDNDEFVSPGEMLQRLLNDNTHMAQAQRAARYLCDDNNDPATSSVLEVIIDETERRKWFLFEAIKGMDNTN